LVVIRVGKFVISLFIPGCTLDIGKNVFKELLGVSIILLLVILVRHLMLVLVILALHNFGELVRATAEYQNRKQ
jgi:hypothetical protein